MGWVFEVVLLMDFLQLLNFFEIFVGKVKKNYSYNDSADGGIGVSAEKPFVYIIQYVPDSPPD